MAKIFVSYKRIDEENVSKIVNRIEIALNEKCWIDNEGVESASQFKNVIIRAINDCEIMLFMYSKTHLKIDYEKDWTMRELNFAMKKINASCSSILIKVLSQMHLNLILGLNNKLMELQNSLYPVY